ncbi:MAG: VWA domain-containing protein [Gemmataceae bacterium]|nr:VWA domain-containing protein [Gemmataceae bacterium]
MLGRLAFLGGKVLLGLTALLLLTSPITAKPHKAPKKVKPKVEVVFCLDTTGSMGGLIEGAKQKIWAMCNQIASGQPTPDLKVGLVAYRDRGDDFITKSFDLTDDLDAIHGHLRGFSAGGGGDEPESVNEALHAAVHNMKWSDDPDVMKIVFLVGDAPPHMDYANDIRYPVTCKEACEKGIIINTIQCGNSQETTRCWKEICQKAEGKFVQIAQDGGVLAVATPYDKRLAEINSQLAQTCVYWGDSEVQFQCKNRMASVPCSGVAPPPGSAAVPTVSGFGGTACVTCAPAAEMAAAADRAGYCGKSGRVASFDLIDGIKDGKVKLDELKKEQLPQEMQSMNGEQRREHLAKVEKDRAKLQEEARELDKKRGDFINKKLAEGKKPSGFDAQVLDMLRTQAEKYHIAY